MTLHDIGKRKAAFPKLLFYVRRWVEGVKKEGITRYEHTLAQHFRAYVRSASTTPYPKMNGDFQRASENLYHAKTTPSKRESPWICNRRL